MSRFIRSAFFPILIVIVLAIIVQVVIRGNTQQTAQYTYGGPGNSFVSQLDQGKVETAVINTKDQTVQVTTTNGQKYSVNYPDTTQLTELLA
ncbi:MAG TPA: ATP-dependent metallopeptidase FtsH/Yme1/Tma family protein, partial [Thermoleophilia bacterium]|nr:ATP-dependent metallopeptidase FtsH/Yme1/Tma family protein [Thermoleophilia bacterium]